MRDGEGAATKSPVPLGRHASRRVDEHHAAIAGEPEELAQHSQTSSSVVRQLSEERLNIGDVHECPIPLAALGIEEAGQIAHNCQRRLDGAVGAGPGARTPSPIASAQHRLGEGRDSGAHPGWCAVDPLLAPSGGEPLVLVGGHRQAALGEERLQGTRQ
ncbi:hypothetical protein [Mycobacterium dioxanotrophicus]|uniref:hypothetical protein n=1 Tax=Mycobacterium dioxanotrophicus TaxID=482462 RepID=UPI0018DF550C